MMMKAEKPKEVRKIKEMIESYRVIGTLNMHKMPAKQLQEMKRKLAGKAVIKMSRKSLLKKAMEQSNLNLLAEKISGEPALIMSNENPFALYTFLKNNKSTAAARANDTAPEDITITKGGTGLPPGPAISQLQSVGLKTSIQGGKISITKDHMIVKAGGTITPDMINVFAMLKMEPMKIGIDLVTAWENGDIYEKSVLDIDEDAYASNIAACVRNAVALSVNACYLTDITASIAVSKAYMDAQALGIAAGILAPETIIFMLAKSKSEADALQNAINHYSK